LVFFELDVFALVYVEFVCVVVVLEQIFFEWNVVVFFVEWSVFESVFFVG